MTCWGRVNDEMMIVDNCKKRSVFEAADRQI